jgi:hypothetical protein
MATRIAFDDNDRGGVLVYVVLGVIALASLLTLAADFGLRWASRLEAQHSADSAAVAGALALVYGDPTDFSSAGAARQDAFVTSQSNFVWGQPPYVDISSHITFPLQPAADCDPEGDGLSRCVRVEVHRAQDNVTAFEMRMGRLLGRSDEDTNASATAIIVAANTSDCLKPWGVADKWAEPDGIWDSTDTFDPESGDTYRPQGSLGPNDAGTGFKAASATSNDYGAELVLKAGNPNDTINPGWFQALDLGVCGSGASCYRQEIATCAGPTPFGIGDNLPKKDGNVVGPTREGVQALIALDPSAHWDPVKKRIVNSCVGPPYTCSLSGYAQSPRVVAVPVFDLEMYLETGGPGKGTVRMVNIIGFFVDRTGGSGGSEVVGYLVNKEERVDPAKKAIAAGASFLKSVMLIH